MIVELNTYGSANAAHLTIDTAIFSYNNFLADLTYCRILITVDPLTCESTTKFHNLTKEKTTKFFFFD